MRKHLILSVSSVLMIQGLCSVAKAGYYTPDDVKKALTNYSPNNSDQIMRLRDDLNSMSIDDRDQVDITGGVIGSDKGGPDLSRTNLQNVDFSGARFIKTKFTGATLVNADLSNCVFEECDFREANLKGANLENSVFKSNSTLERADISPSDPNIKRHNKKGISNTRINGVTNLNGTVFEKGTNLDRVIVFGGDTSDKTSIWQDQNGLVITKINPKDKASLLNAVYWVKYMVKRPIALKNEKDHRTPYWRAVANALNAFLGTQNVDFSGQTFTKEDCDNSYNVSRKDPVQKKTEGKAAKDMPDMMKQDKVDQKHEGFKNPIPSTSFEGLNLANMDFTKACFKGFNFNNCNLTNTQFGGAALNGSTFYGAKVGNVKIPSGDNMADSIVRARGMTQDPVTIEKLNRLSVALRRETPDETYMEAATGITAESAQ